MSGKKEEMKAIEEKYQSSQPVGKSGVKYKTQAAMANTSQVCFVIPFWKYCRFKMIFRLPSRLG